MRVALLSLDPELNLGGIGHSSARLLGCASAFQRQQHDVRLLAAACAPADRERLERRGLPVAIVPAQSTLRAVQNALGLIRPELVIELRSPGPPRGARAAAALGAIHVYDIHDLPPLSHGTAARHDVAIEPGAWAAELESSHAAVVSTDALLAPLRAMSPAGYPVRAVPSGIEPSFLAPVSAESFERAGRTLRPFHGLRVGCVTPAASPETMVALVRAIAKVPSARRIQLAWIGDGPARNVLLNAAHEAHVPLVLADAVARDELPAYLAHLDVVVFPGPAGAADRMAVLEAMAAGRAIVAPAVEPFASLVHHGADGLLAASADEAAFVDALGRLAASGRLRADLGREARHVATKARTWDAVAAEILEFARECAGAAEDVG